MPVPLLANEPVKDAPAVTQPPAATNNAAAAQPAATPHRTVWLEEMTWLEVKDALAKGTDRILIPTAGIEQNGKHLPLNKHHIVIHHAAEEVAKALGNTLVAPVIDFVPEEGHMEFAGTISMREETFRAILLDTVESLKRHGFKKIYLLGDSGGNQQTQEAVAAELNKKYRYADGVQVASLHKYYSGNKQLEWLKEQGLKEDEIGSHAAVRDTSEIMAVNPQAVRNDTICDGVWGDKSGVHGRPTLATADYGKQMLQLKIDAAIHQVKALERIKR